MKSWSLCIMIIFAYTLELSFLLGNYLNKDHWYSIKQSNLSKQGINCQRYEHFYHWFLSLWLLWTCRGHFEHWHGKIWGYFEHFNSKHLSCHILRNGEKCHSDSQGREKKILFLSFSWGYFEHQAITYAMFITTYHSKLAQNYCQNLFYLIYIKVII